MTTKEIIIEAGRFDDVIHALSKIIQKTTGNETLPVNPFVDEQGLTKWRVDGKAVCDQAVTLLYQLVHDFPIQGDFESLLIYVKSSADIDLHNYANDVAHRLIPVINMENIRTMLIIGKMLQCLNDETWDIPDGWKRLKEE